MFRWMSFLVVAAGLAFSACGSKEKTGEAPVGFTAAPDDRALIGSWSDGATTLTLNANQTFLKEVDRGGRNPVTVSGKWSLRGGALYLHPEGQVDEVYDFTWSNEQRSLSMSSAAGGSWNFIKR